MKGVISWQRTNAKANEFLYELDSVQFDTEEQSIRDTIVHQLLYEWDGFGEDGDALVIDVEEEE